MRLRSRAQSRMAVGPCSGARKLGHRFIDGRVNRWELLPDVSEAAGYLLAPPVHSVVPIVGWFSLRVVMGTERYIHIEVRRRCEPWSSFQRSAAQSGIRS